MNLSLRRLCNPLATVLVIYACLAYAIPARATVLVFRNDSGLLAIDDSGLDNSDVNYGDRVAASGQDDFEYGSAGGFTPNVVVDYGTNPTGSVFHGFVNGFGGMEHGVFGDSTTADLISEVSLVADAGFRVHLALFELAAAGQDRLADVTVINELNAVLFAQSSTSISAATRTELVFNTPLEGNTIKIRVQAVGAGAQDASIGFDNIRFSQMAVPEPAATTLLAFGAAMALWARGRRRRA